MIKTYYINKPVKIQAVGRTGYNIEEIQDFFSLSDNPHWGWSGNEIIIGPQRKDGMIASIGDYIILTDHGEFYPCKPEIFEETYQEVEE